MTINLNLWESISYESESDSDTYSNASSGDSGALAADTPTDGSSSTNLSKRVRFTEPAIPRGLFGMSAPTMPISQTAHRARVERVELRKLQGETPERFSKAESLIARAEGLVARAMNGSLAPQQAKELKLLYELPVNGTRVFRACRSSSSEPTDLLGELDYVGQNIYLWALESPNIRPRMQRVGRVRQTQTREIKGNLQYSSKEFIGLCNSDVTYSLEGARKQSFIQGHTSTVYYLGVSILTPGEESTDGAEPLARGCRACCWA